MYEQNKNPIPYDVANALSKALEVDASILYDDFADFLAAPYRRSIKEYSLGSGNVSEDVCGAYRCSPKYFITNSKQGTADLPGRSI